MAEINPHPVPGPFSLNYSPQITELLKRLNCSLALTTYQAGKFIFLSAKDENQLIQLPRNFNKPMGFSFSADFKKMALATRDEVTVFAGSAGLAQHYPKSPGTYDMLYMPRATYHTGALDVHDVHFGENGQLYAVNTLFSCVVTLDDDYNFTPFWMPPQITEMASEDRCHLNGMAMQNGKPKYATAFNTGNTTQSWRETVTTSGVIYDVTSNEIVAEGLAMPHSPKRYNGKLYVLLSAKGQLVEINTATGTIQVVAQLNGFLRGMTLVGDYLFIAHSKLRKNSSTFAKLPFADKADSCGIIALHLPSAAIAGQITYTSSVDEIYDIHALPLYIRPNILNTLTHDHKLGLSTPQATYWAINQPENE
jgi:uncharacterized protein (TIGR03032 family)